MKLICESTATLADKDGAVLFTATHWDNDRAVAEYIALHKIRYAIGMFAKDSNKAGDTYSLVSTYKGVEQE